MHIKEERGDEDYGDEGHWYEFESCKFSDGKCTICNQVCGHDTFKGLYDEYIFINETVHKYIYGCGNCHAKLHTEEKPHIFVGGVCKDCKYSSH